jgi:hypothetical protein
MDVSARTTGRETTGGTRDVPLRLLREQKSKLLFLFPFTVFGSEDDKHKGVDALEELSGSLLLSSIMHGKFSEPKGVANVLPMVRHTISKVIV